MKNFFRKQWKLIIIIIIFYLSFFIFYNQVVFSQRLILPIPITKLSSSVPLSTSDILAKVSHPISLKIPVIDVDAVIEYVGLTSSGAMEVPKDTKNVAWFNLGPLPGETGSAVIAGHFDDKKGQKAVFYDLKKIKKGDQVFVEDSQGKFIAFIVREIRSYDSEAFVPEIFISSNGQHLNLITCSGNWSKSKKIYTQRLVVFTDRVF